MAHTRQSKPDYGLDFRMKILETPQVIPSSDLEEPCIVRVQERAEKVAIQPLQASPQ